jgi:hypothetical protein
MFALYCCDKTPPVVIAPPLVVLKNETPPLPAAPDEIINGLTPPNGLLTAVQIKEDGDKAVPVSIGEAEYAVNDVVVLFKFIVIFINTPLSRGHILKKL